MTTATTNTATTTNDFSLAEQMQAVQEIINDRNEQLVAADNDGDVQLATLIRNDRRDWQFKLDALVQQFARANKAKMQRLEIDYTEKVFDTDLEHNVWHFEIAVRGGKRYSNLFTERTKPTAAQVKIHFLTNRAEWSAAR